MIFLEEDKMSYDELAPSLQKVISDNKAFRISVDALINAAITALTNTIVNSANTRINTDNTSLKTYSDEKDFINLPPRLGFFGETTVVIYTDKDPQAAALGISGLTAQIGETPIFLGGYYSVIPTQNISLIANATNYIYLIRDRYDRTKINISIKSKIMGVEGETAFNKILVSKIITNNTSVVSQFNYEIL